MFSYAKHLSVMGILGGIAGNIDNLLLFHYAGAVDLAIYTFATGTLDQLTGPSKALSVMIQAKFVGHSNAAIRENMRTKMLLLLATGAAVIIVYIPLAPFLYRLLFPLYVSAVPYSQIYAISILGIVFGPAGSYLAAKRKIKAQYISTVLNSLIQILIMAIGVIGWGLLGLIVARVIIRLAGGGIVYGLYRHSMSTNS
jgi:O-antigen/teichoic acid export membrane protein